MVASKIVLLSLPEQPNNSSEHFLKVGNISDSILRKMQCPFLGRLPSFGRLKVFLQFYRAQLPDPEWVFHIGEPNLHNGEVTG